jgi:hypothetical protein
VGAGEKREREGRRKQKNYYFLINYYYIIIHYYWKCCQVSTLLLNGEFSFSLFLLYLHQVSNTVSLMHIFSPLSFFPFSFFSPLLPRLPTSDLSISFFSSSTSPTYFFLFLTPFFSHASPSHPLFFSSFFVFLYQRV